MEEQCARCGDKLTGWSMSYFDSERVCIYCKDVERNHPQHKEAIRREEQAVRNGNFNFSGIGLPQDVIKLCQEARRERTQD